MIRTSMGVACGTLSSTGNLAVIITVAVMTGQPAQAQPGTVLSHQKISDTMGNFSGILDNADRFGAVASLGDLDGNGPSVLALAVGAPLDDDGGVNRGAVWILFLNTNGTVNSHQKISSTAGGGPPLVNQDNFGNRVAALGDLDGDGVGDLAVVAPLDDDGGTNRGAVWILFLNDDGTVKSHRKISDTMGGFTGTLDNDDHFGSSVASLGDLDGNGTSVLALAVGANLDDDGLGFDSGAVWVLFLDAGGTVLSHQKISDTQGGGPRLDAEDWFGWAVASLGDLDGDDVGDLAVGATFNHAGGTGPGAVWILFLNTDGTVKSHQEISSTAGGGPPLDNDDRFGASLASLDDLDGDDVGDLAVGTGHDDDGGTNGGAVWILFLNTDGTVKSHQKISDTQGGGPPLDNDDHFGQVAWLGDLDGDGVGDLAVGAPFDDDGGANRGAVWILFLDGICPWDCADGGNGDVGITDFLALLAQWGQVDTSCDFDGGGVGITDFLDLLANWGACP